MAIVGLELKFLRPFEEFGVPQDSAVVRAVSQRRLRDTGGKMKSVEDPRPVYRPTEPLRLFHRPGALGNAEPVLQRRTYGRQFASLCQTLFKYKYQSFGRNRLLSPNLN